MQESEIVEYQILTSNTIDDLIIEVSKSIQKGWQPLGGHQFIPPIKHPRKINGIHLFSQTMVRYKSSN